MFNQQLIKKSLIFCICSFGKEYKSQPKEPPLADSTIRRFAVIDGGKNIAMTTVDTTVKTAGSISGAALKDVSGVVNTVAETYEGVIDTVVENIDEQTDELQNKPEESK